MKDGFYVTTPIYYVNDVPHIGHAYTTIAADILARFNRLTGRKVFFLTGTDEHGQKVEKAARSTGRTPKEHADALVVNFKNLWKKLYISNDAFIRTTDVRHTKVVRDILQTLFKKGEIQKRPYTGWYCTPDERFWTEKEIIDGNCPECGRSVERIEEENYFFLMSKYKDRLVQYINDHPHFILPESRRNEVLGFLKSHVLGDLCISRPKRRLSWGIPIPFDEEFVTYVWFDALINYYSATFYLTSQETVKSQGTGAGENDFWWPSSHHIIGKDILTTHAVYWPTILMALNMPLPENIFAHGWWTVEGEKMSKSLGNVVDPFQMIEIYGADAFRYFLFREVTFGLDGDFSETALIGRVNSDLANDLGNLVNRTFAMLRKYFQGIIPRPDTVETELKDLAERIFFKVADYLRNLSYQRALDAIWELIASLNKYIDTNQPWSLARDVKKEGRLRTVLYSVLEGLRFISLYLYPFMPVSSERIYKNLTNDESLSHVNLTVDAKWGRLPHGIAISEMPQLFPRIERKEKNDVRTDALLITKHEAHVESEPFITMEDFAKIKLKTGKVLTAERIKDSNKLIKLQVDTGEIRQIVAGIGKTYSPDELVGKTVVVIVNLKPVKLMGVESQGMLLAASNEMTLSILTPERDISPGSEVK